MINRIYKRFIEKNKYLWSHIFLTVVLFKLLSFIFAPFWPLVIVIATAFGYELYQWYKVGVPNFGEVQKSLWKDDAIGDIVAAIVTAVIMSI